MIEEQKVTSKTVVAPEALEQPSSDNILPILPLKNLVVLPSSIIPIIVGRKSSVLAVEEALKNHNKTIFVTAQKHAETEQPFPEDLYTHGTRSTILQMMKMPNNSLKILVEGVIRSKIIETYETESFSSALVVDCPTTKISDVEIEAAWRNLKSIYILYGKLNSKIPVDLVSVENTNVKRSLLTLSLSMQTFHFKIDNES
jgi:ATP-dependent Lon protease